MNKINFLDYMQNTVSNCLVNINKVCNLNEDPFQRCLDVISLTILSYVSFPDLAKVCPVSKSWNALANNPRLLKAVFIRDVAFGRLQWTLCHNQGLTKRRDVEI